MTVKKNKWQARNKNDLIVEVWQQLDCESVGAAELQHIQEAIREAFGARAVESPAAIARLLADEDAVLRHPEVLDFDSNWRQQTEVAGYRDLDFTSLKAAKHAIQQLDDLRRQFKHESNGFELSQLDKFVAEVREDLNFVATSRAVTDLARREAKEVGQWLLVWQRTPELFADWLELRLKAREFLEAFPDFRAGD